MQKNFSFYYSKSNDLTKFAFKKLGFLTRIELFIYVILSFIGKFSFFLRPIFVVADDNIGAMISETHRLCFPKIFEGVSEKYFKLMMTYFVEDLMTVAFLHVIFWPLYFACLINQDLLAVHIFSAVILFFAVLFVLIKRVKFSMIGFVAAYDNNLSMGDYFYNCKSAPKKAGWNIVFNEIVYYLIFNVVPVFVLVYSVRDLFFRNTLFYSEVNVYVAVGALFLCFILYTFWLNKYALVKYTTHHLIAQDACIKKKCLVAKRVPSSKEEYAPVFSQNKADFEKLDLTKEDK